jgi:hypothetical protein
MLLKIGDLVSKSNSVVEKHVVQREVDIPQKKINTP